MTDRIQPPPGLWTTSWRADPKARAFADRHYNRQSIGSDQFVPPGRCLVLKRDDAFWVTSWPFAEYVKHAWPGAWVCSAFRNEGSHLSSDLIRAAVAATRWQWDDVPDLGMVTFVDPAKVRRKRDPGRCFLRAGFRNVGETAGGLVRGAAAAPGRHARAGSPTPRPVATRGGVMTTIPAPPGLLDAIAAALADARDGSPFHTAHARAAWDAVVDQLELTQETHRRCLGCGSTNTRIEAFMTNHTFGCTSAGQIVEARLVSAWTTNTQEEP
jgi:hypothetical protein